MQETPEGSPHDPPTAPLTQRAGGSEARSPELDITAARTLAIFWSLQWRTAVLSSAAGAGLAVFSRILRDVTGWDIRDAGGVLAMIAGALIYARVMRGVLRKRFKEFTIKLFPDGRSVRWSQTLLILWSLTWRSLLAILVTVLPANMLLLSAFGGRSIQPVAIVLISMAVGLLVGLPVNVLVFRSVLRKRFRNFSIKLVPNEALDRPH